MSLNKLEEALLFMFDYFGIESSKPLQIYLKMLDKMDKDWIAGRIQQLCLTFVPKYKGHYPSLAEIIAPLFNTTESEVKAQWELYIRNVFRSHPDVASLALIDYIGSDFKRRYGESEGEASWFKKEFRELYKDFKKQKVGLLEQMPENLLQAKGALMLNASEQGIRGSDIRDEQLVNPDGNLGESYE